MDLLLAKISLLFSLVLSPFLGPSYIGLGTANLSFDFKTGDSAPVYFLAVTNIGPQKARFDLTSDNDWVSIYREGLQGVTSIEISQVGAVNFILTLHPQGLADGSHQTKIRVKAVNPLGLEELDAKEVVITLNKNFIVVNQISSPTPLPTFSSSSTPAVSAVTPTWVLSPTATAKISPKQTAIPPTKTQVPTSIKVFLTQTKEPVVTLTTQPSPPSSIPNASIEIMPQRKTILQLIRRFFSRILFSL